MIPLRNARRRAINPPMRDLMHAPRNLALPLRVRNDLPPLQHQPLPAVLVVEFIMRRGAPQPAFLGAISPARIRAKLEIKLNLIEALFTHLFVLLRAQLAPVDNRIHEPLRVTAQVPTARHAPDLLEPQRVPDPTRRHVRLVHKVEHTVRVAQHGRPRQVRLAHEAADAAVARGVGDEEAGVGHVARAARVVGLDVEAAEAGAGPVVAVEDVGGGRVGAEEHDGAEVLEPVGGEGGGRHAGHHGVGVAAGDFFVEEVREVLQQAWGHVVAR